MSSPDIEHLSRYFDRAVQTIIDASKKDEEVFTTGERLIRDFATDHTKCAACQTEKALSRKGGTSSDQQEQEVESSPKELGISMQSAVGPENSSLKEFKLRSDLTASLCKTHRYNVSCYTFFHRDPKKWHLGPVTDYIAATVAKDPKALKELSRLDLETLNSAFEQSLSRKWHDPWGRVDETLRMSFGEWLHNNMAQKSRRVRREGANARSKQWIDQAKAMTSLKLEQEGSQVRKQGGGQLSVCGKNTSSPDGTAQNKNITHSPPTTASGGYGADPIPAPQGWSAWDD